MKNPLSSASLFFVSVVAMLLVACTPPTADAPKVSPPPAVAGLKATPKDKSVVLAWEAAAGAATYCVYYKAGSDVSLASNDGKVDVTANSATVSGLKNGTSYAFAVAASNKAGAGPLSAIVISSPKDPLSVTGLKATPKDQAVDLSWDAVADATGYRVYYKAGSDVSAISNDGKVEVTANSATVSGLKNGTGYAFAVEASTKTGSGQLSAIVISAPQDARKERMTRFYSYLFSDSEQPQLNSTTSYSYVGLGSSTLKSRVRTLPSGRMFTCQYYWDSLGRTAGFMDVDDKNYLNSLGSYKYYQNINQYAIYDKISSELLHRYHEVNDFDANGNYIGYSSYRRDEEGKCEWSKTAASSSRLDAAGKETGGTYNDGSDDYSFVSIQDEAGNVVQRTYKDKAGTIVGYDKYVYDQYGNEIESDTFWIDGTKIKQNQCRKTEYELYTPDFVVPISNNCLLSSLVVDCFSHDVAPFPVDFLDLKASDRNAIGYRLIAGPGSITMTIGSADKLCPSLSGKNMTVSPVAQDPKATIAINGAPYSGGAYTWALKPGENDLAVKTTAQDGTVFTWNCVLFVQ